MLDGASGLGKTVFAMNLLGPLKSLEVNCANTPEPDLREYDSEIHQLILFDEASVRLVLSQKNKRKLVSGAGCYGAAWVLDDELPRVQNLGAWGPHGNLFQQMVIRVGCIICGGQGLVGGEFNSFFCYGAHVGAVICLFAGS